MLCTYCGRFDFDALVSLKGFEHHASYGDLALSAQSGCVLCKAVQAEHEVAKKSGSHVNSSIDEDGSSSQIRCFLGVTSSTLRWEWRRASQIMAVTMAVSSIAGDPSEYLINANPICTDAASDQSFDIITSWVEKCSLSHTLCARVDKSQPFHKRDHLVPSQSYSRWKTRVGFERHFSKGQSSLPSRVINVGSDKVEPFLVISNGELGTWVTLSHCWGNSSTLTTKTKTLESRTKRIALQELPATFRDAVLITRRLGYQYLWIDSLCIIQDSPEDWLRESAKMGDIYKNSTLTIAAEAAADSDAGIFASTNSVRSGFKTFKVPYHRTEREYMLVQCLLQNPTEARGPLSRRGWTLQEDLLSPRTLRFAAQQVWWRCQEMQCNERDRRGLSFESQWNSDDMYQVASMETGEDISKEPKPSGLRSTALRNRAYSKDRINYNSRFRPRTNSEDEKADTSEDDSALSRKVGSESQIPSSKGEDTNIASWTAKVLAAFREEDRPASKNSAPSTAERRTKQEADFYLDSLSHHTMLSDSDLSTGSDSDGEYDFWFQRPDRRPHRRAQMRPATPELSNDFITGLIDEDLPPEGSYRSNVVRRSRLKSKRVPQDIDPSFPKSDPEDEAPSENDATYTDKSQPPLDTTASHAILQKWYNIVNDFAIRKITYPTDKFPALSGLAREIRRMTGNRYSYKAGIWRSRGFEYKDLLWGIISPGAARHKTFIAPSWSWASIDLSQASVMSDGRGRLYNLFFRDLEPKAEVKAISTTTVNDDPYTQVLDGILRIEGFSRHVCRCEVPRVYFDCHDSSCPLVTGPRDVLQAIEYGASQNVKSLSSRIPDDLKDFKKDAIGKKFCASQGGPEHGHLVLLEIAEWSSPKFQSRAGICLVLELSKEHEDRDDVYRRVGRAFVLKSLFERDVLSRWRYGSHWLV